MGDKEPPRQGGSPSHPGIMTQVSPLQVLQSQLGLTPQQLQLLVHNQQLAFQSVSIHNELKNAEKNPFW